MKAASFSYLPAQRQRARILAPGARVLTRYAGARGSAIILGLSYSRPAAYG